MYHGYIIYKVLVFFFLRILLHYQHTFPLLRQMLYVGHLKLFAEASELFT
jgi:hypothetical protein